MEQKILLIDDSAILRRIATNVLSTRAGCCEVVTATRATEGFAMACAAGVGLILVDYQLAGQPNAELCRRLHEEPRTSRVPVVLLLGRGMSPPSDESLPANVVDFLVKPFTPEQLVSTVKTAFETAKGDAPVRRLRGRGRPSPPISPSPLTDHHEIAAAVSAAALARHETNRVRTARSIHHSKARTTALARGDTGIHALTPPARLRAALNEAAEQCQTGVFHIRAGNAPATDLYLENGQIVVVSTQDAGRYGVDADEVVPPKVSPAILEEAVAEQARTGVPFLLTLGSRGLLSKATALALLHRFGQQHFARLWTTPQTALVYEFDALDAMPGFALRLEPRRESVDEWLLGTLRHVQPPDLTVFARREGYTGTAVLSKKGADASRSLGLCEQEREFVRHVQVRGDLPSIARALGVTVEHVYYLLFRLRCLEIMEYRPSASAFVVTPRTNVRRVLPLQR